MTANVATTKPLIELRNATRRYRTGGAQVGALNNVTLTIQAGEFVAVMGPSGSGKSTLMNIIGCLDRPTSGEYYFKGQPVKDAKSDELARLRREIFGFVFQNYNLLGLATARENVEMPAIYAGTPKGLRLTRAVELLSRLGLTNRLQHQPRELSGGEQQRVAIARALMNGGRVLLADEPTGSLDSRSGQEVMSHLKSLSDQGHTVIVVTHDAGVASHARRRIQLLDGRVIADTGDSAPTQPAGRKSAIDLAVQRQGGVRVSGISLKESVRTALRALRSNRFRTALTLLGIVIGVLSVTALLGLAEGVRRQVLSSFEQLGGASLTIVPSSNEEGILPTLTLGDSEAIRSQAPNLVSVTPLMRGGGRFLAGGNVTFESIIATTARSVETKGTLARGVYFTDRQDRNYEPVVVLGGILANELFGDEANPIGEHLMINGLPFLVIGMLKRPEDQLAYFNYEARSAYVPLMTGAIRLFNREDLSSIEILVADTRQVEQAQQAISRLLESRHATRDFRIISQQAAIEAESNATNVLKLVFGAIGGISLIVAGIGVMNIMLATVAERTREIGVRMATGARQRDILFQFVCEAVVVSGIGGLVGLSLALALGAAINSFGTTIMAFTVPILLIGLSCATLTGLLFGFAPARRAARMDPVAALAAH